MRSRILGAGRLGVRSGTRALPLGLVAGLLSRRSLLLRSRRSGICPAGPRGVPGIPVGQFSVWGKQRALSANFSGKSAGRGFLQ